jgi:hypothetical protein
MVKRIERIRETFNSVICMSFEVLSLVLSPKPRNEYFVLYILLPFLQDIPKSNVLRRYRQFSQVEAQAQEEKSRAPSCSSSRVQESNSV